MAGRTVSHPIKTASLQELIVRDKGFKADFTHFSVAGLCADCQQGAGT
ncbi:MAG: hypothetical protein H0V97_01260 [Actinobacteria bacterium]|nr:hypothetical protein [Actinomycetota bacterium]